jgi:hypothetical protein
VPYGNKRKVNIKIEIMEVLGLIVIYVIGYVLAYQLIKHIVEETFNKWTTGDRLMFLILSAASFISLIAFIFVYLAKSASEMDKKAKW